MQLHHAGSSITPVILTYDEEPNIRRTLASLSWARDIVVLDSGSTDATASIARSVPAVRWFERKFDSHGKQWRYALEETGISSDYILALDADMNTPSSFVTEAETRFLPSGCDGGVVPFEYWMLGQPLLGSVLPPQLRLFRRCAVRVGQEGHTQTFAVDGTVYRFAAPLCHDDRKSVERWVNSQLRYSEIERLRLTQRPSRALKDRVRRMGVSPPLVGAIAYLRSGGPLGGRAALRYAWERVVFECLLAMRLLDHDAEDSSTSRP
jgi:glycosyltransferase involved in cell wall biosynthesis